MAGESLFRTLAPRRGQDLKAWAAEVPVSCNRGCSCKPVIAEPFRRSAGVLPTCNMGSMWLCRHIRRPLVP